MDYRLRKYMPKKIYFLKSKGDFESFPCTAKSLYFCFICYLFYCIVTMVFSNFSLPPKKINRFNLYIKLIDRIKTHTIGNPDRYYFLLSFIVLSILVYFRFSSIHSGVYDLGIYTSTLFKFSSLGYYGSIFFGHSSPYLIFYALVYSLSSVIGVLTLQSAVIAYTAYFVKKHFGVLTFVAYCLYFATWFNALFDFHPDHLSILFLFLFFKSVQHGEIGKASIFAIALALVKEVFALQTIMCGVYLLVSGRKGRNTLRMYLHSIGIITFGLSYFYIATHYIIPLYSGGSGFIGMNSEAFSYLGTSFSEILLYIFANFNEIFIDVIYTPGKVFYLVALFGALGFIPLLNPKPLIVALPILAISLLSHNEGYYGIGHHYTAGLIAPMIFAFYGGLPRAKLIWHRIGLVFCNPTNTSLLINWFKSLLITGLFSVHIALAPSPISRLFWSDKVWTYNYKAYIQTDRDIMIKSAISNFIPIDPDVVVSIQNTINWPPLVQRRNFLLFPQGVVTGQGAPFFSKGFWPPKVEWKEIMADYVVLDLKRPWFLIDKGCDWLYGKCADKNKATEYLKWVEKSREVMKVVFEEDGFLILKINK